MGWGSSLWDRIDRVEKHTNDGLEFSEKLRNLVTQVSQAELEYAKQLKKIIKTAAPAEQEGASFSAAYADMIEALGEVANQHENISANLVTEVTNPLKQLHKNKHQERANLLAEVANLNAGLNVVLTNLDKTKKKYEKAEKDAELAVAAFEKAEKSDTVTKAKVISCRTKWVEKSKYCDAVEQQLVDDTDTTNQARTIYYRVDLPKVMDELQAWDENRAEGVITAILQVSNCYVSALPVMQQVLDGACVVARRHNKGADSELFAQSNSSGAALPGDLPVHEKKQRAAPPKSSPRTARASHVETAGPPSDDEDETVPSQPAPHRKGPAVLHCRAMYAFAGTNEGELPVAENEILQILQNDGSGWVLVSNATPVQGYVPESYIALVNQHASV